MKHETTGTIEGFGNVGLFYRVVEPEGEIKGTVLIVHGYSEHSGRYGRLIERLTSVGFRCFAFDHRGHGRSEGLRGFILRTSHCLHDIEMFVDLLREKYGAAPLVLFGHSFSAALVCRYAGGGNCRADAIITSAMYLKNGDPVPALELIVGRMIDILVPSLPIHPFRDQYLCRDPEVIADYRNDPLCYHGNVRIRTGLEFIAAYEKVCSCAPYITVPAFLFHGTGDRMALPGTTPEIFELLGSDRKQLRMYDGLYHEPYNDPGGEQVYDDIVSWLDVIFE